MSQRHKQRHSRHEAADDGTDGREGPCQHLKVILLGDMRVGKTSLLQRFVQGKFDHHVSRTVNIEEMEKEVRVDNQRYLLRLVDTCGGERFRTLRENFYRSTDICLLTFALDNLSSFCNLTMWREEFLYYSDVPAGFTFPFVIVGNKADVPERAISDLNTMAWCRANGDVPYFETSAKQFLNVEEVFVAAVRRFREVAVENASVARDDRCINRGSVIGDLRDPSSQQNTEKSNCCS